MEIFNGTDIVCISRFERYCKIGDDDVLPHFITRCYTDNEIRYCLSKANLKARAESFAARFAAKEAVAKAMGTGIMTMGIGMTDIEIINNDKGAPLVNLFGRAKQEAEALNVFSISVSLSHDGDYATAYCSMLAGKEKDRV